MAENEIKNETENIRPPDKKPDKVITGKAKKNKTRFSDVFSTEDVGSVRLYLLKEVVVPGIKRLVSEVVKNGIDSYLYPDGDSRRDNSTISRPSYSRYYDGPEPARKSDGSRNDRTGYSDIIVKDYQDAKNILAEMDAICARYKMVSIAALYESAGLDSNFTDNDYGWTSVRNAKIVSVRDGYLIKMPRPIPLD